MNALYMELMYNDHEVICSSDALTWRYLGYFKKMISYCCPLRPWKGTAEMFKEIEIHDMIYILMLFGYQDLPPNASG